ncbi:MAG: MFS transporter [Planctomycetota bacterium]|jgi:MFS family permease
MNSDERRNARKCIIGEGLFGTGMGLVAPMTVFPLLLEYLGASDLQLGVGGSIAMAGWFVLQPAGLFLFGRRRRTKRFLVPWSLSFAVPTYLAMGLGVYVLGSTNPQACVVLLLGVYGVRAVGAGSVIPFWLDWQAMIFRRAIRGRVLGGMAALALLGSGVAQIAAGKVQDGLSFPGNYTILFMGAAVFFVLALVFYAAVREPSSLSEPYKPLGVRDLFGRFAQSLREVNFRNYLVGRALMTLGGGAAVFYAVYFAGEEGGGLERGTVTVIGGVSLSIAHGIASYVLGRLGDRKGHKTGIVVGSLAQIGAITVAFLGRGAVACAATFALAGVAWSAAWVSHNNMLFETCPHDSRVAHITLSNMVLAPFLFLVPMATGWMMGQLDSRTTGIGLTLIPTLLGVAWLVLVVKEPRHIEISSEQAPVTGRD